MTRDQLIETMARAISDAMGEGLHYNSPGYQDAATAALTAIEAAGMRVVPVEPTEKMIRAGGESVDFPSVYMGGPSHHAKRLAPAVYKAMLAAHEDSTSE